MEEAKPRQNYRAVLRNIEGADIPLPAEWVLPHAHNAPWGACWPTAALARDDVERALRHQRVWIPQIVGSLEIVAMS